MVPNASPADLVGERAHHRFAGVIDQQPWWPPNVQGSRSIPDIDAHPEPYL
jgi:hypothetical protein